ncbi:hypothetical protein L1887_10894 [Cichorium endivia]|nr:hypothetical protein L1887_10894 [Cichorium endivia]
MLLTCISGHQSLYIVIVTVTVFYIYFSRRDKMILHLVFGVVIVGFFFMLIKELENADNEWIGRLTYTKGDVNAHKPPY